MGNPANNGFDPKAFLAKVGAGKTILKFAKNQHVFRQGDVADAVFYIQKGSVKLTVLSKQGKEAVVGILEPGQFFGEGCLNVQSSQLLIDGRHVDPYAGIGAMSALRLQSVEFDQRLNRPPFGGIHGRFRKTKWRVSLLLRSFRDRAGQIRLQLHIICFCLPKLSAGFDQSNDGA